MSGSGFKMPKFMVIGHRGHGMNVLHTSDRRMRAIKENTIMSFNAASTFPIDYIEFDVQVTPLYLFLLKLKNKIILDHRKETEFSPDACSCSASPRTYTLFCLFLSFLWISVFAPVAFS